MQNPPKITNLVVMKVVERKYKNNIRKYGITGVDLVTGNRQAYPYDSYEDAHNEMMRLKEKQRLANKPRLEQVEQAQFDR